MTAITQQERGPESGDRQPVPAAHGSAHGGHRAARRGKFSQLPYLSPGMLGFAVFIVIPLLASFVVSFFQWPLFGSPTFVGLENYRHMFAGDPAFWVAVRNTVVFAVVYTVMNLVVALGLSYWLMNLGAAGPRSSESCSSSRWSLR